MAYPIKGTIPNVITQRTFEATDIFRSLVVCEAAEVRQEPRKIKENH